MACWSPLDAMKAYMHTLHLCKDSSTLIEPKSIEYIAALAAGSQAQLMVDVASGGMSPSTLALAIAARHTGGRLICVRCDQKSVEEIRAELQGLEVELNDVEFKVGNPCDVMKQYKNIDFAVVDHRIKDCEDLFFAMDMNPKGSVVVVSNLFYGGRRPARAPYGQIARAKSGAESVVLPIDEGMEVTRIGKGGKNGTNRRRRRTFVVYEE